MEGPNWLTEGMADYARDRFGDPRNNGDWKLMPYDPKFNYTAGYVRTAPFLKFVEGKKKGSMKKIFDELRAVKYTEASWKKLTGQSLDQWWQAYSKAGSSGK